MAMAQGTGNRAALHGHDVPRPSTRPRWIDADEAMLKLLAIRSARGQLVLCITGFYLMKPHLPLDMRFSPFWLTVSRQRSGLRQWFQRGVWTRLWCCCRGDLEVIRTMADQVHRREKQRRRELLQWREDWRGVLSMDPAEALENLPAARPAASADRESRLANRAAMQAAREASTLVGAQVSRAH